VARSVTMLQVFLASPSDVQPEREIVSETIQEFNRVWGKAFNVALELWRWEEDSRPAFGPDAQSIINSQVGENYDIFVGILWGRFGSPTPRAASGTQEEFQNAVTRRKAGSSLPEIMLYFKDAPIAPSKIDSTQLSLVQHFKRDAGLAGIMYSTFVDESSFESSFRAHLSSLVQEMINKGQHALPQDPPEAKEPADTEELGFIDYMELYESRMRDLTGSLNSINAATVRVGSQLTERTKQIREAGEAVRSTSFARQLLRDGADDLMSYANFLDRSIPEIRRLREGAFEALASALMIYGEFAQDGSKELVELRNSLGTIEENVDNALQGIDSFYGAVKGLPRLTSEMNKAKRETSNQLASFRAETVAVVSTVQNILKILDRLLEKRSELLS
jgi:uncharacterized protein YoxC